MFQLPVRSHVWVRLLVVLVSLGGSLVLASPALDLRALASQPVEARRAALANVPRESLVEVIKATPAETLLDFMQSSVEQLGIYRTKLEKRERVGGKMGELQTLQLTVREKPQAIRAEFVSGPSSGRKALYDTSVRAGEVRVREAGLLGIAGSVWLSLDNSLTRRDTNHPINHLGFAPLIHLLREDQEKAKKFGGLARVDEGFDAQGRFCTRYTAPANATGLYSKVARVCFDPVLMLPTKVEVEDAQGPLETLTYSDVGPGKLAELSKSL